MIWIVYRTTCKINGKFYIGVHKTETDEIFDGYYGNGIQIPKHTYSITHPKYHSILHSKNMDRISFIEKP